MIEAKALRSFTGDLWDRSIVPALQDYVRIPNQSPMFDPGWREHGHMERAVELVSSWVRKQAVPGMTVEVVRSGDRTPLIVAEVPGKTKDTVLLYGHLDKQPPMEPWADGLGPWKPVIKDGRLFGRGASDDGYAAFAATAAMAALAKQQIPHARLLLIIEAGEESGSPDLEHYVNMLAGRLGSPTLVVCLDSGCGDYDRLWSTTSLRGLVGGTLKVQILGEGVHSGDASGIVPSSFRILRSLLSRLEDEKTGAILPKEFHAKIPDARITQAKKTAEVIGDAVFSKMPWIPGSGPISRDKVELILNRTWRPMLAITGQEGMPAIESAGNVLRPWTSVKVSLRLPPSVDAGPAAERLKAILEADPPYGARVTFEPEGSTGWDAPAVAPWLEQASERASSTYFGNPACYFGEGGSIPFMGMLGQKFPAAQFLVTGVLGPHSNAHGPNEFLDIACAKNLTCCVAEVLAAHAAR